MSSKRTTCLEKVSTEEVKELVNQVPSTKLLLRVHTFSRTIDRCSALTMATARSKLVPSDVPSGFLTMVTSHEEVVNAGHVKFFVSAFHPLPHRGSPAYR